MNPDLAAAVPPPSTPPLLSADDIAAALAERLPGWRCHDGHLQRVYKTAGWPATLMITNAIAHLAEAAWHHPEMALSYAQVVVSLSTHDSGGVTARDLALAERIEQVLNGPLAAGSALTAAPAPHRLIVG